MISTEILDEVERTLGRPYFRRRLPVSAILGAVVWLITEAERASIEIDVRGVATHPEDDRILATAVSAEADYLVTGDRKLLALESYEGVSIVSPTQFLAILAGD